MPPKATGTIIRRATKQGTMFSLRIPCRGEKHIVKLGGSWEGWTEERVEANRQQIAELMAHGEWVPPAKPAAGGQAVQAADTFATVAAIWLGAREKRVASAKSRADLRWRLWVANGFLGEWPLDQITEGMIDDMVTALLTERAKIKAAADAGTPVMESYVDSRTGRTHERRRRGLSNSSINKVLRTTRLVFQDAKRRKLIVSVPIDGETMVRDQRPERSLLQAGQALALLEGARELETRGPLTWGQVCAIRASEAPATHLAREYGVSDSFIGRIRRGLVYAAEPERAMVQRWVILAVLIGTGIRVSELCGMRVGDVDLAQGRITIGRQSTKTDAGARVLPLLPATAAALADHLEARGRLRAGDLVFVTSDGTAQSTDNVRRNVIAPAVAATNAAFGHEGPVIGHCTPHSLRRTYASVLAELGVHPRRAMYLMGHTDPEFTMGVYQQVLNVDDAALGDLEQLLGCDLDRALVLLSGREGRGFSRPAGSRSDTDRTLFGDRTAGNRR